jgi:hypothetical protein
MSILKSTNSGRKLVPITAGILKELGWIFNENKKSWKHCEYTDTEIYQESSFRKEVKEKRGLTQGNWYAIEIKTVKKIIHTVELLTPEKRIIPLNCICDLDLLEKT